MEPFSSKEIQTQVSDFEEKLVEPVELESRFRRVVKQEVTALSKFKGILR